jgi:hypothetical protein
MWLYEIGYYAEEELTTIRWRVYVTCRFDMQALELAAIRFAAAGLETDGLEILNKAPFVDGYVSYPDEMGLKVEPDE